MSRDLSLAQYDLLSHAKEYHRKFYDVETFGGPSLHFHRRALGLNCEISQTERSELIYATLVSWGMHRMGSGGSKMRPFEEFRKSVAGVEPELAQLSGKSPSTLQSADWATLERVFGGIQVMRSGATIVGNSKVMAHLLPHIVAPIDREYTLKYLFGQGMFSNDLKREWNLFRKIHEELYFPVANDARYQALAADWMSQAVLFPWDTSILKTIDNLVIGARLVQKRDGKGDTSGERASYRDDGTQKSLERRS